jgi:hypothetical protein
MPVIKKSSIDALVQTKRDVDSVPPPSEKLNEVSPCVFPDEG